MGDMREVGQILKEQVKQSHATRVAKTPARIEYAANQFEKHGIRYLLKNNDIGHFHVWRKSDNKLFQFWAGTGKIMGFENQRGIKNFIKILTKEKQQNDTSRT